MPKFPSLSLDTHGSTLRDKADKCRDGGGGNGYAVVAVHGCKSYDIDSLIITRELSHRHLRYG